VSAEDRLQVLRQRADDGGDESFQFVQNAVSDLQLLPASFNLKNTNRKWKKEFFHIQSFYFLKILKRK